MNHYNLWRSTTATFGLVIIPVTFGGHNLLRLTDARFGFYVKSCRHWKNVRKKIVRKHRKKTRKKRFRYLKGSREIFGESYTNIRKSIYIFCILVLKKNFGCFILHIDFVYLILDFFFVQLRISLNLIKRQFSPLGAHYKLKVKINGEFF